MVQYDQVRDLLLQQHGTKTYSINVAPGHTLEIWQIGVVSIIISIYKSDTNDMYNGIEVYAPVDFDNNIQHTLQRLRDIVLIENEKANVSVETITFSELKRLQFCNSTDLPQRIKIRDNNEDGFTYKEWVGIGWIEIDKCSDAVEVRGD